MQGKDRKRLSETAFRRIYYPFNGSVQQQFLSPVCIGGLVIQPGDIVVGDEDGLVAVPQGQAVQLIASARATRTKEDKILADIAAGKPDRAWVDKLLRERGCDL